MREHLKSIFYMGIAGVLFWLFLPEKYAVNMPFAFANSVTDEELVQRLKVADGFDISIFANKLPGARAIVITDNGDIIVSRPNSGKLTLVFKDADQDGLSDGSKLLLKELDKPHGITIHNGWLFIAETNAVLKIKYDANKRTFVGPPKYIIRDSFPGDGNHWARSIKVGPDNKLYVSVGSSCNACIEQSKKRGTILQYDLDGKNEVIYAQGLRNTTGFDWQPITNLMYGVDIGRDFLGDALPAEELNQINRGQHYGWPYEYGNNIVDSDFTSKPGAPKMTPPAYEIMAHSTPLSILFLKHHSTLKQIALVAQHGSWNRSEKSGYNVISLTFGTNNKITQSDFINGFENDGSVIGRPVDLAEDKNGNIYLSDDYSGKIYKITATHTN